jgi:cellulose 1,4-beta-cellobiosidase
MAIRRVGNAWRLGCSCAGRPDTGEIEMGKKNDWKRARPCNGRLALAALVASFVPLGGAFAADAGPGVSGASAGCGANRLNPGDSRRTIDVNGQARSYFLHVPRSYTGATAVPLIVDYHGHGGNGEGEKNGSGFAGQSEISGFIVAYPDGLGGNWNYHVSGGVDDLGLSKAIINDLGDQGCIDKSRVYAAGFSQGGGMSYGVACYAADAFAAVVSSSFDLYDGQPCSPARPISVLSFRGTADPLAIYSGSPGFGDGPFVGAKETLKRWAAINHCSGSPRTDSNGCEIYTRCDGGSQIGLCTVQGGGHLSGDPRTSWEFLKQFSLPSNGNNDGNSCTPTTITPYVQVNDGSWQQTASVTVDAGAKVKFGPQPVSGGSWSWSGGGTSGTSREQTISPASSIAVATTYTNNCNAQSTQNFTVNVNSAPNPNPNPNPSTHAIDNGRYNIVSSLSGLNLDISGAGKNDGANVIQYNGNGGANQQFDVEALGDGTYSIRAAHSGKALDVFQWNANDGAELRQWSYTGGKNQRWIIADTGGGLFSITSAFSNKVVDVWQMNKTNGGAVKLYHWTAGPNQKWSFVRVGANPNPNPNPNPDTSFSLTVGASGKGTTDLTAGGHTYKSGSKVTIKATPDAGYEFAGWSGAFTGNTNPLTITIDGNKTLTATFTAKDTGGGGGGGGMPSDNSRVANPYVGADRYVDPEWSAAAKDSANRATADLRASIAQVAQQPTSVWLDRLAAIDGSTTSMGLAAHLDAAVQQQAAKGGGKPMLVELVVYDLPDRDCAALASNGELKIAQNGMARYKTEYIDRIVEVLESKAAYQNLRIVTVIEPDSLPNAVTNLGMPACATAAPAYKEGVAYAIKKLAAVNNVYIYLDMAHSAWLGWDWGDKAAQLYKEVMAAAGGENLVRGFATNVANYSALKEPFNPYDNQNQYQSLIENWYEWNRMIDEETYVNAMRGRFPNHHFLIDTGRNGWKAQAGGVPIEARAHRGNWCNSSNAGIGQRPSVEPMAGVDAFVWIKPPGASDGTSDSSQTTPDAEGKRYDPMCGTGDVVRAYSKGKAIPTDALSGAPAAGKWFDEQFFQLVRNATPALDMGGDTNPNPPMPTPTLPNEPVGLSATVANAVVTLKWSDKSNDEQGFRIERRLSTASTWTTLSNTSANVETYADSTVTAGSTYEYRVSAFNSTGNSAAIVTSLMVPKAAEPLPTAPSGLAARVIDNGTVSLAWTDNSGNETGFRIERRVAGDATWTKLVDTGANTTAYSDVNVPMGKSYEYRVSGLNASGASASTTAPATLLTLVQYGEQQYKEATVMKCAKCHGADGKSGGWPLANRTVSEFAALIKIIADTMPNDKRLCINNCAQGTAAYIIKLKTGVSIDESGQ